MISHVKFVSIPTRDQDRSLKFWTERAGFRVLTDQPFDEKQRWIELRIGSSETRFVLFMFDEQGPQPGTPFSGALACDNVEQTYQEMIGRGVEFAAPLRSSRGGPSRCSRIPTATSSSCRAGSRQSETHESACDGRSDVTSTRTFEKLLGSYPSDVRALALGARRLIRRLLPDVEESVDASAPVIGYGYGPGYRGVVCTLILSQSEVKLGVVRGSELPDPRGLLQGSGKVHRYVPLAESADLRQPGVSQLIKTAYVAWQERNDAPRRTPRRKPDPRPTA